MADLVGSRELAQPLADRARELGAQGIVVPSAGRSGGWNLVVFPGGFDRIRVLGRSDRRPLR
jgi:RES domain-containing protein